jgi:hypothetical protein
MTVYSDKFDAIAAKLEGLNGEAVTRHPGDGSADVPLTAWAVVLGRIERRHDAQGSERFVQVANLRFARLTVVADNDTWTVRGEADWSTKHVVMREPSVRIVIERPVSRTVGGPALSSFEA